MPGPAAPIDAKQARRPPSGLLAAAEILVEGADTITRSDGRTVRWIDGFTWDPEDATGGTVIAPCDTTDADDGSGERADRDYDPYIVQSAVICDTWGNTRGLDVEESERKLRGVEQARIEEELWLGTEATAEALPNAFLADAAATGLAPGLQLGFVTALGVLEKHAYDVDDWREPMIHCTRMTATHWAHAQLLIRDGAQYFTPLGTRVVVGGGYDGTGPSGFPLAEDVDSDYAYVTDRVRVLLGELDTQNEDLWVTNRDTNEREVQSYRFAAAFFDGSPHAFVHVDHTTALTTTGS